MDLAEQVHIFGLTNIHTFGPNISLIRLFSLMLNYAKPRMMSFTVSEILEHHRTTPVSLFHCKIVSPGWGKVKRNLQSVVKQGIRRAYGTAVSRVVIHLN